MELWPQGGPGSHSGRFPGETGSTDCPVHPSRAPLEMGQEQRGLPGQGTVQAARVHGRGARNERGSRRQPGKLTSSLAVTFHGPGQRTGGPDPFKEPSLQAGTDRHRVTQSAICSPQSRLCHGFFLKQENLLFQASD